MDENTLTGRISGVFRRKTEDVWRNLQFGINIGIGSRRKPFDVIRGKIPVYAVFFQDIDGFVIGDGCFCFAPVDSYDIIAPDMDADFIQAAGMFFVRDTGNPVETVYYFDIFVTEIRTISVDKPVILSAYRIIFYAVTVQDTALHTIIIDKKMPAPTHNLFGRIIEQVVNIEL